MAFPDLLFESIIHRVLNITGESTSNAKSPEVLTIYVGMPYDSDKGLSLLNPCLHKIQSYCAQNSFH